jgi:hypothetical protein
MVGVIKHRVWTLALVAGLALAATGTALAAGSSLHVKAPHAKVKKQKHCPDHLSRCAIYDITVVGSASTSAHLYVFIDSHKCGPNPAVEFSRSGPYGTAYGYFWKKISGRFKRSAGFSTITAVKDHACTYLASESAPKNSAHGVVARSFRTYKVRK